MLQTNQDPPVHRCSGANATSASSIASCAFHIDMLTEQNVRGGMRPSRHAPRRSETSVEVDRVKDDVRDTWLSRLFGNTRAGRPLRPAQPVAAIRGFAFVVDPHHGARHRRQHRHLQRRQRRAAAAAALTQTATQLVVLRQQQPLAGVDDIGFLLQGDPRLPHGEEPRRRRRVPQHVVHPARPRRAGARLDRRRVRELLRRAGRAADVRTRRSSTRTTSPAPRPCWC